MLMAPSGHFCKACVKSSYPASLKGPGWYESPWYRMLDAQRETEESAPRGSRPQWPAGVF